MCSQGNLAFLQTFLLHAVAPKFLGVCKGLILASNISVILSRSSCAVISPRVRRREHYREIRSHIWENLGKRQIHGWSIPLANTQVIYTHYSFCDSNHFFFFTSIVCVLSYINRYFLTLTINTLFLYCSGGGSLTIFSYSMVVKCNFFRYHKTLSPSLKMCLC